MNEDRATKEANKTSQRIPEIDALRLVSILGVVAIHVFGLVYINEEIRGQLGWKISAAIDVGSVWAVPGFIMLSGYLNLRNSSHVNGPGTFYRRRLGTILIPMIFWHIFYIVAVRWWLKQSEIRPVTIIQNLIDGKVYTALYFFWIILGLYLVAPVLNSFIAAGGQKRALFLGVSITGWTLITFSALGLSNYLGFSRHIDRGALTMWIFFVGYFVLGFALREIKLTAGQTIFALFVAVILLGELVWQNASGKVPAIISAIHPGNAMGLACTLASILLFLVFLNSGGLISRLRINKPLAVLSDLAFGVFCVHLFFLALVVNYFGLDRVQQLPFASATFVYVVLASFTTAAAFKQLPLLNRLF